VQKGFDPEGVTFHSVPTMAFNLMKSVCKIQINTRFASMNATTNTSCSHLPCFLSLMFLTSQTNTWFLL